jgi:hypothetical protein
MLRRVALVRTEVSEELSASFILKSYMYIISCCVFWNLSSSLWDEHGRGVSDNGDQSRISEPEWEGVNTHKNIYMSFQQFRHNSRNFQFSVQAGIRGLKLLLRSSPSTPLGGLQLSELLMNISKEKINVNLSEAETNVQRLSSKLLLSCSSVEIHKRNMTRYEEVRQ